jgi:hypothetical protein
MKKELMDRDAIFGRSFCVVFFLPLWLAARSGFTQRHEAAKDSGSTLISQKMLFWPYLNLRDGQSLLCLPGHIAPSQKPRVQLLLAHDDGISPRVGRRLELEPSYPGP